MREKIARCIYSKRIGFSTSEQERENALLFADAVLSPPSGLIAGEHELTIAEILDKVKDMIWALEKGNKMVLHDCGHESTIFTNALTFNGHRITKPIPPSEDER